MHEVQEQMKNTNDVPDAILIELVVYGWETVCKENEEQRHLVSDSQFSQWLSFRDGMNAKIKAIVESYEGILSESDRTTLGNIATTIADATHKTQEELIAEQTTKVAPTVNEKASTKEQKPSWLARLKKLIKK